MSDEPKFRKRRRWPWIVAILLLYPLSIGPAVWINKRVDPNRSGKFSRIAEAFYFPLHIVVDYILVQPQLWNWYLGLWVDPD